MRLPEPEKPKRVEGLIYRFFKAHYAPFLMRRWVKYSVVIMFLLFLCTSIAVIPYMEVGLEQELSMPEDSFVLTWFQVRRQTGVEHFL